MIPPSLDYRVTQIGRKVDSWGYGDQVKLRTRLTFFLIEVFFRAKKYRKVVILGAAGWAILNAYRFYVAAFDWLGGSAFALASAALIVFVLWLGHLLSQFAAHR